MSSRAVQVLAGSIVNGQMAVFVVKPNTGYIINTVTGCAGKLSNTTYTTGTITSPCTVKATFKVKVVPKYTVTVRQTGTGSGTISGGGQFPAGATVKLTAAPDEGSTFKRWSPEPCTASLKMPSQNLTCTAKFELSQEDNGPEMVSIPAGCFMMGSLRWCG